jgi:hypothetical protein
MAEFQLQRATWLNGQMVTDPPLSVDGDPAPRPGDPARTARPEGVIGRPDTVSDGRSWYEGQLILDRF